MKYERIKFLVLALKNAVEVYAWAPKPYHKFMAFKVSLVPSWISNHRHPLKTDVFSRLTYLFVVCFSLLVTWCTGLCWLT